MVCGVQGSCVRAVREPSDPPMPAHPPPRTAPPAPLSNLSSSPGGTRWPTRRDCTSMQHLVRRGGTVLVALLPTVPRASMATSRPRPAPIARATAVQGSTALPGPPLQTSPTVACQRPCIAQRCVTMRVCAHTCRCLPMFALCTPTYTCAQIWANTCSAGRPTLHFNVPSTTSCVAGCQHAHAGAAWAPHPSGLPGELFQPSHRSPVSHWILLHVGGAGAMPPGCVWQHTPPGHGCMLGSLHPWVRDL